MRLDPFIESTVKLKDYNSQRPDKILEDADLSCKYSVVIAIKCSKYMIFFSLLTLRFIYLFVPEVFC